ncbi:phosphatase PAP2 family protein [Allosphingosinicella vermicomposti]|uniref:phosphatase PAP2 family protein n=1 Tax=Allosphingosinicella vermicomposti TaxID=614671 RepID=UPI000D11104C|nr:phosphatase PAP2 family protein [Allosphingosinicella vermicomposti]
MSSKSAGKSRGKSGRGRTRIEKADVAVAKALVPHQDHPVMRTIAAIADIGDQPPLQALSWSVLAAGLVTRKPRLAKAGARMIVAHLFATVAKDMVKHRVDRTRPHVLEERDYEMKKGKRKDRELTSFPSGHTAGAVAVAQAFARAYPEYRTPALGAAGVVALAQIPRCAHYPTDVGAGAAIGVAAEWVVDRLLRIDDEGQAPYLRA